MPKFETIEGKYLIVGKRTHELKSAVNPLPTAGKPPDVYGGKLFSKITVGGIAERADVNRTTFYLHFSTGRP